MAHKKGVGSTRMVEIAKPNGWESNVRTVSSLQPGIFWFASAEPDSSW
jgi:hypothetical protein